MLDDRRRPVIRAFLVCLILAAIVVSLFDLPAGLTVVIFLGLFGWVLVTQGGKFSCRHCGKNVKLGSNTCHHCGREVSSWYEQRKASQTPAPPPERAAPLRAPAVVHAPPRSYRVTLEPTTYGFDTDGIEGDDVTGAGFHLRDADGQAIEHEDPQLAELGVAVFKVAGTSFRRDALQAPAFAAGQRVALVQEPENEHDPNAVAVYDKERRLHVGYVPAEIAADVGRRPELWALILWEWRDTEGRCGLKLLAHPPSVEIERLPA